MSKINLEVRAKHYVKAPSFCPYECIVPFDTYDKWADPRICVLCKLCEFVPETVNLKVLDSQSFVQYINNDIKLATSISGQNQYLLKENRIPIAIFLSPETFQMMLESIYPNKDTRQNVYNYYMLHEEPLCKILGCPVYLSTKLTRSNVQVVGEIQWR